MRHAAIKKSRVELIDIARGIALLAMAVYHFGWDLELFGYMEPGTAVTGGWRLFARSIATSFLFLVGVSLFLAHAKGVRWPPFLKRLAMVIVAAAAITAATWAIFPSGFIFFGILHHIALASLLGLLFLHLPVWLVLALAAGTVALPYYFSALVFDNPALWWVGLSTFRPHSNDYVPLFPWFGAVLAGIAAGRLARDSGLLDRMALVRTGNWSAPLRLAGQHSLAFYLLHQPVLIACVWAVSQVFPPALATTEARFVNACTQQCSETRDAAFCKAYCDCFTEVLRSENRLESVMSARSDARNESRLSEIASECTMTAETGAIMQERDGTNERP
ncbi:hypothetical protein NA8A_17860 [Nitratireductor indicus C115]|uniref:Heparan-alpha-glucosaminide N-acetyltransferase catalytic domain-containing protein n=1 Tax=Nitratireductor indicus C115 TaxID=1231190 RepID=K2NTE9_9HYPH|nr:DUF1624 domain-containing protein [Nitratireductor indicus]EKF41059.1 hypothetical protein NA8A_17860 [Nitratireductor indicus C115]SFQ74108.1 Uncharacterized membrane protein [Nitratireductor indicus]